jgi:hypothetical protein
MQIQVNFTGFEQKLLVDQKPFFAKIYEGREELPEGFNVVCIPLDASDRSLLQWQEALLFAQKAIERGFLILWELQFALLEGSLDDEIRFMTLELNVQHFHETVWAKFQEHSFGVALYRGELQEGIVDDLKSLAAWLAEEVSCFLFVDTTKVTNLEDYFKIANQEAFGHLYPILKGPFSEHYPWAVPSLSWGHGSSALGFSSDTLKTSLPQQRIQQALCLPKQGNWDHIQQAIDHFGALPFRVIPENLLAQEWEGIDTLIIFPQTLTEKTSRKIEGFQAAGGEVIAFSELLQRI